MKLYTKQITNCLLCPNRDQKDKMNADRSNWILIHTCSLMNREIAAIDMHLVNKQNLKDIHLYKRSWFPDWCPLENVDIVEASEE